MITGIVLVGVPCSGKSEIGKRAANALGIRYISSGDIAREIALSDKCTYENLNSGKMAEETIMRDRMKEIIENLECGSTFILDGFPRFKDQALWLDQFTGIRFIYVMINVPLSQAIDRMHIRGRDGDYVKERMGYYYTITYVQLLDMIQYEINNDDSHTIEESVGKLIKIIKEEV